MRNIKTLTVLVLLMLFVPSNVNASNVTFGADSSGASTGVGQAKPGGGAGDWVFWGGIGLKVNLVKVEGNSIKTVGYYYIVDKTTDSGMLSYFKTGCPSSITSLPTSQLNQLSESVRKSANCNYGGAESVFGSITNGEYSADVSNQGWVDYSSRWFSKGTTGINIVKDMILRTLRTSGGEPSNTFYQIVSNLFVHGGGLPSDLENFPLGLNSPESIKHLLNDAEYSNYASMLNDYKIVIEPIYAFNHYGIRRFATLKTVATANFHNNSLGLDGYADAIGPDDLIKNLYYCGNDDGLYGPINKVSTCGNFSYADMKNSLNGLGYMLISITENKPNSTCDPNSTCCYDSTGNYHASYYNAKVNYRCSDTSGVTKCPINQLEPCLVCDPGTTGPYSNYYLFLAKTSVEELRGAGSAGMSMNTTGQNTLFRDTEIFKSLMTQQTNGLIINNIITKDEHNDVIDDINVKEFYSNYIKSQSSGVNYYQNGNDYYITTDKWCKKNGDSEICYNSDKLKNDVNYYANRSISAYSSIARYKNNVGSGFTFDVKRQFTPNYSFLSGSGISSGDLYHPAAYVYTYCVSQTEEIQSCDDTVSSAVCQSGNDSGTAAVFHENDDLKACTLNPNVSSGFNLIKQDDLKAMNGNSYCSVACKDDVDIKLPTNKYDVASGTYFTLDNYQPDIKTTRTCVTSRINFDGFVTDLESARDTMIAAYNYYKDMETIYNQLKTANAGTKDNGTDECECRKRRSYSCTKTRSDGTTYNSTCHYYEYYDGTYKYEDWEIFPVTTGLNDISNAYSGLDGRYETKCQNCSAGSSIKSAKGPNYSSAIASERSKYKTLKENAFKAYETAQKTYQSIIGSYEKCSSWSNDDILKINPKVTLHYDDDDASYFGDNILLKQANKSVGDPKVEYWPSGTETDSTYSSGGQRNPTKSLPIIIVNCGNATTCTSTMGTSETFITSPYIKSVQTIEYSYEVPTISASIPSGKIEDSRKDNYLVLENAVPINIKTQGGIKQYSIVISGIKDSIRTKAASGSDNFEDRFNGQTGHGALNSGNEYVCYYEVVNDIYDPVKKVNKFFYRVVDLTEINPNNRELGYNWTGSKAEKVIKNMAETNQSHEELTTVRDSFEFTITSTMMKEIRDYNKTQSNGYSDWNLRCSGGDDYHCYSNFLTCLASGGTTREAGMTNCSEIFRNNVLQGYTNLSNYDYNSLVNNREILIEKMKKLGR